MAGFSINKQDCNQQTHKLNNHITNKLANLITQLLINLQPERLTNPTTKSRANILQNTSYSPPPSSENKGVKSGFLTHFASLQASLLVHF